MLTTNNMAIARAFVIVYVIVVENERRLDEELFDLKQVKDELRDKRHRCIELEVRNVVVTYYATFM